MGIFNKKKNNNPNANDKSDYGTMQLLDQGEHEEDDEDIHHHAQEENEKQQTELEMRQNLEISAYRYNEYNYQHPTLYFDDGVRKIDYILMYEEKVGAAIDKRNARRRKDFEKAIQNIGIELEKSVNETETVKYHFVKVHLPWAVVSQYAEDLLSRARLLIDESSNDCWSAYWLHKFRIPNIMSSKIPWKPNRFITAPYDRTKLDKYVGSEDLESFFSSAERSRLANYILSNTLYGDRRAGEVGIDRLIEEKAFHEAYPLHDGPYSNTLMDEVGNGDPVPPDDYMNTRQMLYLHWARWTAWYKYQPIEVIRLYFGEKIGIYFSWLGFYTSWLLPAAIVGFIIFMIGILSMGSNPVAAQVCEGGKTIKMCPICSPSIGCEYYYLSDDCFSATVSYAFDNPGTVFFSIFMCFWAVSFLEYWKRKEATLAFRWDTMDFEAEEERPRPRFSALAPSKRQNPITGQWEPYMSPATRLPRYLTGLSVILVMASLVVIFLIGVIVYRTVITIVMYGSKSLRSSASSISGFTGGILNLVLIMLLSRTYSKLAHTLTEWEMHRTQTEFEDHLTFKVFCFQFVNFYAYIFYIAFFKGRYICGPTGCLVELATQLAIVTVGKQIIGNAKELFIPMFKNYLIQRKIRRQLAKEKKEKLKLLQFGFVTVFVASFPLAPFFALLNNWVEIRLDANKYITQSKRPVAEKAQDIGVWYSILEAVTKIAVICNAFVIAFTSEFIPRMLYKFTINESLEGYINFTLAHAPPNTTTEPCRYKGYRNEDGQRTLFYWELTAMRLAFVIVFEHLVFGISVFIAIMVPDVPKSLDIKIKRERFLAENMLTDPDDLDNADDMTVKRRTMSEGTPMPNGHISMDESRLSKSNYPNLKQRLRRYTVFYDSNLSQPKEWINSIRDYQDTIRTALATNVYACDSNDLLSNLLLAASLLFLIHCWLYAMLTERRRFLIACQRVKFIEQGSILGCRSLDLEKISHIILLTGIIHDCTALIIFNDINSHSQFDQILVSYNLAIPVHDNHGL
ncbi:Anoctamin-7, partial [Trichoplax sp. H2]